MLSLRDAAFALDAPGPWSLRGSLVKGLWPSLPKAADGSVSVRALAARYSAAGAKLRILADGKWDMWTHIDRSQLVPQLRDRLRDPGIIWQTPTHLCGPLALILELARRLPAEYVRAVTELLETGRLRTGGGMVIKAERELREEPVAKGDDEDKDIDEADWILAATMRDDANYADDVDDDAKWGEAMTLWYAMSEWTRNMVGLTPHWEDCFYSGELDAIRHAQEAVDAGGVAFLLIDSDLIKDANYDGAVREYEENMWWSKALHEAGKPVGGVGEQKHSRDDNPPPDHWVVLLGDLQFGKHNRTISMRVWSWGGEYLLSGKTDSFTEYLYGVVTGRPE